MTCFIHTPSKVEGSKNSSASTELRKKHKKKYYLDGSFDSVGKKEVKDGKEWKGHKMMKITDFLSLYDTSFVTEEDYI